MGLNLPTPFAARVVPVEPRHRVEQLGAIDRVAGALDVLGLFRGVGAARGTSGGETDGEGEAHEETRGRAKGHAKTPVRGPRSPEQGTRHESKARRAGYLCAGSAGGPPRWI